jgi:hypothetical protein
MLACPRQSQWSSVGGRRLKAPLSCKATDGRAVGVSFRLDYLGRAGRVSASLSLLPMTFAALADD